MLKIVFGKSGCGKSTYIYEDIKKNIDKEKIFVIVPEQSNLSTERELFKYLKVKALFNVQVLTLSRLAVRILEDIGGEDISIIDNSAKNMVISDILYNEKEKFLFLGKNDKNVDIVSNVITELKKHNINLEMLYECEVEDSITKLKIKDIKIVFEKYIEKLKGNFVDENDILSIINPKIQESTFFENALIYIDDFLGFTPQEYVIFESILTRSENTTIAITIDNFDKNRCYFPSIGKEQDVFYFNKIFGNKIIEIAKKNNIKKEFVFLKNNNKFGNVELKYLSDAFSTNIPLKLYNDTPQNIKLFLANNMYSEMEYIANEVLKLIKEEEYKYSEIAIITNDIELYSLESKIIFNKYDIPIFIDSKKDLNQNLLIRYIIAIFDIFSKNWSFESVFNYIKLGLFDESITDYNLNLFENYCIKWGIKNYKWFRPFSFEPKNDVQDLLEIYRKKIIEPLIKLKEVLSKNSTAEELTKNLYNFVIDNKIDVILNMKLNIINNIEISNEYNTSYKIFTNVLDNIVSIFGNQKMSFEEYKILLQVGFNSSELGTIPATQDQVILGDCKRSRNDNIKACFIVGVNDGNFPTVNKFEGFLNDNDRKNLKGFGIELAKTSEETMYENNFEIYNMLSLPSSKLYISYCSQSKDGKSLRPSILIKKIKKLFPKIIEQSDIINKNYYITNKIATFDDSISIYKDLLDGKEISKEWKEVLNYYNNVEKEKFQSVINAEKYTNIAENISPENIDKMYGKKLKGSISKLEQYRTCPFAFHLKYGLKLKEKEEFKMKSLDTGTFMHEVIDSFFGEIESKSINVKDLLEENIKEIVNRIIDEILKTSKYYIFLSTSKFSILTRKLKNVIVESIEYIVYSLKNSDFKVYGHEIVFGNDNKYKPIIIELEEGNKVQIEGKIDRLDIGIIDEKTFIRIIDYKSRIKNLDLNKFEAGLQIQLITYLDAICKQDNFEPAGILYSSLIDSKYKLKSGKIDFNEEEIKNSIRKNFKMNGIVLADINVVKLMDKKLGAGITSDIIPVGLTSSESFDKRYSKVLNREEFNVLQNKVNAIIKEISNEILHGKIEIKPYNYKSETGCIYCNYNSICRFNPNSKDNSYNYI